MLAHIRQFFRDEKGATAIEYGMIAALISVVIITVLGLLGDELEAAFQSIVDAMSGA